MATSNGESSTDSRTRTSISVPLPYTKPNSKKIKALLDRTGYTLIISPGQRKYGGPPPELVGHDPDRRCQIFVANIPLDMYEDTLIPLFEEFGPIWELRIMMNPSSNRNRGYAFLTFKYEDDAKQALSSLDNYEIAPNKLLHLTPNRPNTRLFIGNIPKCLGEMEIKQEFKKLTNGISNVIIYSSQAENSTNRGFCFLEYDGHKEASYARRRLTGMKVFGCNIAVDWADPQKEPEPVVMDNVKRLFVRNLSSEIDEEKFYRLFAPFGYVEHVKRMKNFGFVHFRDRNSAMKAMLKLNGTKVNGWKLEVSLSKPPLDNTAKVELLKEREKRKLQMAKTQDKSSGSEYGFDESGYDGNRINECEDYRVGYRINRYNEYGTDRTGNRRNEFRGDRDIYNNRNNENRGDRGVYDNRSYEYRNERTGSGYLRNEFWGRDQSGNGNRFNRYERYESGYGYDSSEYRDRFQNGYRNSRPEDRRFESVYPNRSTEYRGQSTSNRSSGSRSNECSGRDQSSNGNRSGNNSSNNE